MDAYKPIFHLPQRTIDYWNKIGTKPVLSSEITLLEEHIGATAPKGYSEFLKVFGGVDFGSDITNQFGYSYPDLGQDERHNQTVGHIQRPERALRYYQSLLNDTDLDFPSNLLPFAMDLSQGELFVEFGKSTERIFYWDFDNHDWTSVYMRLGFVAYNMYEFINNLKSN